MTVLFSPPCNSSVGLSKKCNSHRSRLLLHNARDIIGVHQMIIAVHVGVAGHAGIAVTVGFTVGEKLVARFGVDHIITGTAR